MKTRMTKKIKSGISLFLALIFILMSCSSQANELEEQADYCYKPSKPLFFSTAQTKNRYAEDMQEYQRCKKSFIEMQDRSAKMKKESDMNSQLILDTFMDKNH